MQHRALIFAGFVSEVLRGLNLGSAKSGITLRPFTNEQVCSNCAVVTLG